MKRTRRQFLAFSLVAVTGCVRARFRLPHIRVVQLTDIHWGYEDGRYRQEVPELIALTNDLRPRPAFVVCTGDNICGDKREIGLPACREFCEAMRPLEVPWIWVWGNHDGRSYQSEIEAILDEFGIEHRAPLRYRFDGLNLVFLDSGDGLHTSISDGQLQWFEREFRGDPSPVFAFFHIPVVDRGVDDDEQANQEEVVARLQAAANLRACFFGHDHEAETAVRRGGALFCHGRRSGGYGRDKLPTGLRVIDIARDGSLHTWTIPKSPRSDGDYSHPARLAMSS